jgi:CRP-like cAMP-binding protein
MEKRTRERRADGHWDVLGGLSPSCRDAVIAQCKRRSVAKGTTLWVQGAPAQFLAVVDSGKVVSHYQARNGKAGTIGFWCAGDIVGLGDIGVINTRQHTLRCLERCTFLILPFEDFYELVRRFPEFGLAVIRAFSIRLRWVAQLAVNLETGSASERICAVLLTLSERFGVPCEEGVLINLQLTNEQLAAIAGVTRQFTNSTLRALRERGLLASRQRAIILTDVTGIERIAYQ